MSTREAAPAPDPASGEPVKLLATLVSSFGFVGYAPIAPGTAGSVAGLVVWWLLGGASGSSATIPALVLLTAVGVWSAGETERRTGRTDPGVVVVDEVVGMLVTLAFVPVGGTGLLLGFLLFRLFDIVKPFPARRAERLPGGWGIMADDIIAGVYANIVLQALRSMAPGIVS